MDVTKDHEIKYVIKHILPPRSTSNRTNNMSVKQQLTVMRMNVKEVKGRWWMVPQALALTGVGKFLSQKHYVYSHSLIVVLTKALSTFLPPFSAVLVIVEAILLPVTSVMQISVPLARFFLTVTSKIGHCVFLLGTKFGAFEEKNGDDGLLRYFEELKTYALSNQGIRSGVIADLLNMSEGKLFDWFVAIYDICNFLLDFGL